MSKIDETYNTSFSLKQVTSWQINGIESEQSNIVARLPSMQRGAVWEAQQVEMLWDSIFRGFPIGSIVLIKKISTQSDKHSVISDKSLAGFLPKAETTHHILDGQQRCNAIAWGFADPWKIGINNENVLWIDLNPTGAGFTPSNDRLKSSTRNFLFRFTTKAHPWGFNHGDNAEILGIELRRDHFDRIEILRNEKFGDLPQSFKDRLNNCPEGNRPLPSLSLPIAANFPIPFNVLIEHFSNLGRIDRNKLANHDWVKIAECWSKHKFSEISDDSLAKIENGLVVANRSRLNALLVPDSVNAIDDIEQIFQRLNGQGTPLDNEELVYSMIKAYWPEIEDIMDKIELKPITEVRLVALGIRVALTDAFDAKKIEPELTTTRIRRIFGQGINTESDRRDQQNIRDYFSQDLKRTLEWIDKYFLYDKNIRTFGIPAYLRSSIAWKSQGTVFLWLMYLAKRLDYTKIEFKLAKRILGLALTIHWFADYPSRIIDRLLETDYLLSVDISAINKENDKTLCHAPLRVEDLQNALKLDNESSEQQLINWKNFWDGIVIFDNNGDKYTEKETDEPKKKFFFINKLVRERELLIYQQRDYIADIFSDFDPSNKLMWKGHNRPWDYDHILPTQLLNARGRPDVRGLFHPVCTAWQQSIGNLKAIDLSLNRRWQDSESPQEKYPEIEDIESFCIELSDTKDLSTSRNFVLAAMNRLIGTYKCWYNELIKFPYAD